MTNRINGWLSGYEEQLLTWFAKRSWRTIVEIGSFQGKSTVAMAKVTANEIYAVDPHYLKSYTKFLANTKRFKNILPVKKTSAEAHGNWRQQITLLHVDGAHDYKHAKEDLKLWLPHLVNGGVVICHDAFAPYPEVWQAVREEIFTSDYKYIGVLDSQVFAVKGRGWNWQRPFIVLASDIWHQEMLPYGLRDFLVKRVLKPFYLNKFMIKEVLRLKL